MFSCLWHPSGVQSDFVSRDPGVSLRSTPGYSLPALRAEDTPHQASCSYETGEQVSDTAAAAIVELMHGCKPRWVMDEKVYAAANLRAKVK